MRFVLLSAICWSSASAILYDYKKQGADWLTNGWQCLSAASTKQSPVDINSKITIPGVLPNVPLPPLITVDDSIAKPVPARILSGVEPLSDVASIVDPIVDPTASPPAGPTASPPAEPTANENVAARPILPKLTIFSTGGYHKFKIEQSLHSIRVIPTGSSDKLVINGVDYRLKFYDLRAPAEHTVNNKRASLEVQMGFQNAKEVYAFMSFMFNGTDDSTIPLYDVVMLEGLAGLDTLNNTVASATSNTDNKYDILDDAMALLTANDASLHTYEGSLTYPPCTEGIQWFVWDKFIPTPTEHLASVAKLMKYKGTKGNYRIVPHTDFTPVNFQTNIAVSSYPKGGYMYSTTSAASSISFVVQSVVLAFSCVLTLHF
eukprot:Lankesteria_metandrocarpae@DN5103_c0_g1_i1.p1